MALTDLGSLEVWQVIGWAAVLVLSLAMGRAFDRGVHAPPDDHDAARPRADTKRDRSAVARYLTETAKPGLILCEAQCQVS